MARFKNQVSKGVEQEQEPETKNHFPETKNQKLESQSSKPKTKNQKLVGNNQKPEDSQMEATKHSGYSESDMELVNVAGFKVPYVVREYWKAECRKQRVKLSPTLKSFLTKEFGLPPGFSLEDL